MSCRVCGKCLETEQDHCFDHRLFPLGRVGSSDRCVVCGTRVVPDACGIDLRNQRCFDHLVVARVWSWNDDGRKHKSVE